MKRVYFITLTMYQLYVADTYLRYIQDNYETVDGYIINVGLDLSEYKNKNQIKIIDVPDLNHSFITRIWQRTFWGGRLFKFSPLKCLFKEYESICFIFNDNEPISNKIMREAKKNNNKVAIIEEGIGIYSYTSNGSLTVQQKLRKMITAALGSPMQYKAIGDNPYIDYAIVSNVEFYKKLDKSQKQIVLYQNKEFLFKHSDDFLKQFSNNIDKIDSADYLYLGQPFDEYGRMLEDEKNCIVELFKLIPDDKDVLIKPHPRECANKYDDLEKRFKNVRVLRNTVSRLPAECIVGSLCPSTIISFNSSAGVNLANTFSYINCVFLFNSQVYKPVYKYWNQISAVYGDDIFTSKNHNIFLPKTDQELREVLNRKSGKVDFRENDIQSKFIEIDRILGDK